jgi:hypothetical protein
VPNVKDRLEQFKRNFDAGAPPYQATPEVIAIMRRATAEIKSSGIEARALKVGDRAPDFVLFNQNHLEAEPRILQHQGRPVMSFFQGHWCPISTAAPRHPPDDGCTRARRILPVSECRVIPIKNCFGSSRGIRFTGMPGLGKIETSDHIWELIEYVRALPRTA